MAQKWTKAHKARVREILGAIRRETRPFPDTSPEAAAARQALPFDAWMHEYFPHYATCASSPLHLAADEILEEQGLPTAEFWFRGAGKTTRALLRRVRRILERRARFIIVGGQTEENAAEKLDLIELELVHNERLRQDYGGSAAFGCESLAPRAGSDTDTDWIAVETRLLARGTGQSCRGLLHGPHRPDDFLGDDLEDDLLARNPQREKHLWQWLFGNVFPALSGAGANAWCEILLNNYGTRHGLKSRFQEAAGRRDSNGRPLCRYIEYLAEDETGESTWPERFSTTVLRRMSAIMGRALYGREMLGKSNFEEEVFRPEWIREFRSADFDRAGAEVRVAVDPSATAKETSDYKALVVLARPIVARPAGAAQPHSAGDLHEQKSQAGAPVPHFYCLHAWLRRASPNELIAEILRVKDAFSPGRIACEANGFQTFLWPLLEANEEIRGRVDRVGLFPVTNAASKEDRILSLQPDFEQGRCYFDEGEGDQRLLLDQFLDFGKPGVHDDGPDAFEMARRLFREFPRSGAVREPLMRLQPRGNFAAALAEAGVWEREEEE